MVTWDSNVVREQAAAADDEMQQLWAQINGLNTQKAELQSQVGNLQNTNTALTTEIANLEAEISDLEQRLAQALAGNLKPALEGLITTDPNYRVSSLSYAKFASKKLNWKDLNPSQGVFNFTAVDNLLAAHPGILFRLRFMAGTNAPDWAKARSGGAIQHTPDTQTGAPGQVPRFWTQMYYEDYMWFMSAVAARYEGNPQVVEIPNSLTTTIYAEPFILNADAATIDRYWAAGYNKDLVRSNIMNSMHGMMDLFPTTRISLAGHGKWEYIVQGDPNIPGDGKIMRSWEDERTIYNELINTYGPRLVLDDHGLSPGDVMGVPQTPRELATTWYNYMASCEGTDQTYGWQFTNPGDQMGALADAAVSMGACFLEFAGFNAIPEPKRRQIHDALIANAVGKP